MYIICYENIVKQFHSMEDLILYLDDDAVIKKIAGIKKERSVNNRWICKLYIQVQDEDGSELSKVWGLLTDSNKWKHFYSTNGYADKDTTSEQDRYFKLLEVVERVILNRLEEHRRFEKNDEDNMVHGDLEKENEYDLKNMTGEEEPVLSDLDYDDPFEDMDEDELGDNEYYEGF